MLKEFLKRGNMADKSNNENINFICVKNKNMVKLNYRLKYVKQICRIIKFLLSLDNQAIHTSYWNKNNALRKKRLKKKESNRKKRKDQTQCLFQKLTCN